MITTHLVLFSFFDGASEVTTVTGGGYTPYSVYDPGHDKKIRARRQELRQERVRLRADLRRLLLGEPLIDETAEAAKLAAKPRRAAKRKARAAVLAATRPTIDVAAIEARRARLEALGNEIQALQGDLDAMQARAIAERRRIDEENELLMILLLAA